VNTTTRTQQIVRGNGGKRRTVQLLILIVLIGCGLTVPIAITAFKYRFHLILYYQVTYGNLQGIKRVPNRPMPLTQVPEGWVRCELCDIEFSLPPELAANEVRKKVVPTATISVFHHDGRNVTVMVDEDPTIYSDFPQLLGSSRDEQSRVTLPRVKRACYLANSDDFAWSMTRQEVLRELFYLSMSKPMRISSIDSTESDFRSNFDGLLQLRRKVAFYHWETLDHKHSGLINFIDPDADPEWMRTVCRSVSVKPK